MTTESHIRPPLGQSLLANPSVEVSEEVFRPGDKVKSASKRYDREQSQDIASRHSRPKLVSSRPQPANSRPQPANRRPQPANSSLQAANSKPQLDISRPRPEPVKIKQRGNYNSRIRRIALKNRFGKLLNEPGKTFSKRPTLNPARRSGPGVGNMSTKKEVPIVRVSKLLGTMPRSRRRLRRKVRAVARAPGAQDTLENNVTRVYPDVGRNKKIRRDDSMASRVNQAVSQSKGVLKKTKGYLETARSWLMGELKSYDQLSTVLDQSQIMDLLDLYEDYYNCLRAKKREQIKNLDEPMFAVENVLAQPADTLVLDCKTW